MARGAYWVNWIAATKTTSIVSSTAGRRAKYSNQYVGDASKRDYLYSARAEKCVLLNVEEAIAVNYLERDMYMQPQSFYEKMFKSKHTDRGRNKWSKLFTGEDWYLNEQLVHAPKKSPGEKLYPAMAYCLIVQ